MSLLITGAFGFLGRHVSACVPHRESVGGRPLVDLCTLAHVKRILAWSTPSQVIHLAYPGSRGIVTSVEEPSTLASDLLRMDINVIEACAQTKVSKLLCVGSVCSYPSHTVLPTDESQLWYGYPEATNAAYGMAKRMQLVLLQAARQQYGLHGIQVMLGNLYGPGDRSGHVIPSLIQKVRRALRDGGPVVVWGHPTVTRSFLYVEDAAEGIVRLLDAYDDPSPLNLCAAEEISMADLVMGIAAHLGYSGEIRYDTTQPTGHLRRVFDTTKLEAVLSWRPPTPFHRGLHQTIDWMVTHVPLD